MISTRWENRRCIATFPFDFPEMSEATNISYQNCHEDSVFYITGVKPAGQLKKEGWSEEKGEGEG